MQLNQPMLTRKPAKSRQALSIQDLSDEQVLKEFVRRFQCDGAVLMYLDDTREIGFGRWRNAAGRNWVREMFGNLPQPLEHPLMRKIKTAKQDA